MKKIINKILLTITLISLISILSYLVYNYINLSKEKNTLKETYNEKEHINFEYISLFNTVIKEVGFFEKIENETELLSRKYTENEELLTLLEEDLDRLNKENNIVESEIIQKEKIIEERKKLALIEGSITYNQFPKYPTGCESVALYILLKYNGVNNVTPEDIINNLRKGELPYKTDDGIFGGNPEVEFIGDPRNNYSYGVYNKPLADVANKYKSGINSKIGMSFEDMLNIVKEKRPVLVWTTINLSKPYSGTSWIYKETGEVINWISGEHVVVVIGYNDNNIIVSDPYTGTIRYFDRNLFKSRYNFLGKRVLYY